MEIRHFGAIDVDERGTRYIKPDGAVVEATDLMTPTALRRAAAIFEKEGLGSLAAEVRSAADEREAQGT